MSNIVNRLRNECRCGGICLRCQSADYIEAQDAEIERLRAELEEHRLHSSYSVEEDDDD